MTAQALEVATLTTTMANRPETATFARIHRGARAFGSKRTHDYFVTLCSDIAPNAKQRHSILNAAVEKNRV